MRNKSFTLSLTSILAVLATMLGFGFISAQHIRATDGSNCTQLPSTIDAVAASKLSANDLHRYGLQARGSLPLQKWQMMVNSARYHVCGDHYETKGVSFGALSNHTNVSSSPQIKPEYLPPNHNLDTNWSGYIANGVDGPYVEADMVFYVPTVTPDSIGGYGVVWVGLGGVNGNLVQTGVSFSRNSDGSQTYQAWVENLGATTDNPCGASVGGNACFLSLKYFPVSPGDRMQVRVVGTDMYIANGNSSHPWSYEKAFGPAPSYTTADYIIERPSLSIPLAKFYDVTFYGMGLQENVGAVYTGPYYVTNDYVTLVDCVGSGCGSAGTANILILLNPLQYNTTFGPPNDSGLEHWNNYS